jgi:dTDP-4-dehydrorhamnose reductase
VVNCVGIVKQLAAAKDPVLQISVNALFPHQLSRLCGPRRRVVHVSTDCVFSGRTGSYREADLPDPLDLYGRSKLLGELQEDEGLTLRTSVIGHELGSEHHGLVEWFLSQRGTVRGFRRAIYSGLPTVVLAQVLVDHVLPRPELRGVYHVASEPISKHELLLLLERTYGRGTIVEPSDDVVCDRSLDSSRFRRATGWQPPPWPDLVRRMHDDHCIS